MSESVLITDPDEIAAVKAHELEGEHYESDNETWANVVALAHWRANHGEQS